MTTTSSPDFNDSPSNTNLNPPKNKLINVLNGTGMDPYDDLPGNCIYLNDNGNRGLTQLYRDRRNFLFQDIPRGKKRKAFTNDFSNEWIQKEIIDYIIEQNHMKQLRFFNGELNELTGDKIFEAIQSDIENYTGTSSKAKKKENKIKKTWNAAKGLPNIASPTMDANIRPTSLMDLIEKYQEIVGSGNKSALETAITLRPALLSIFRAILNDATLMMYRKELDDEDSKRSVSIFIEQAWKLCSSISTSHATQPPFNFTVRFVRTGENINLAGKPSDCIADLKVKLNAILNVSCENQCLTFKGIVLEDRNDLHFYRIVQDSIVDLIIHIRAEYKSNHSIDLINREISNLSMKNHEMNDCEGTEVNVNGVSSKSFFDIGLGKGSNNICVDAMDASSIGNDFEREDKAVHCLKYHDEMILEEETDILVKVNADGTKNNIKTFNPTENFDESYILGSNFDDLLVPLPWAQDIDEWSCWHAAKNGNLHELQLAHESGCIWDERTCSEAARNGHFNVLRWAHEHGCLWDEQTCSSAAENGHLYILQWAHTKGCPWDERTCSSAAENGHLSVLEWARQNGCPWDALTCSSAASNGHLDILQWAKRNGCPWDAMTCERAASNGHLHVLQWAREHGCDMDKKTCSNAAYNGYLKILQWARKNGCPWDERTCSNAARNGHLHVLEWAHKNGCPWDVLTCLNAARNGHLNVLQWAREHNCPWDEYTCLSAAGNGHFTVLQWARANGCPWNEARILQIANDSGHTDIAQWIIDHKNIYL